MESQPLNAEFSNDPKNVLQYLSTFLRLPQNNSFKYLYESCTMKKNIILQNIACSIAVTDIYELIRQLE